MKRLSLQAQIKNIQIIHASGAERGFSKTSGITCGFFWLFKVSRVKRMKLCPTHNILHYKY